MTIHRRRVPFAMVLILAGFGVISVHTSVLLPTQTSSTAGEPNAAALVNPTPRTPESIAAGQKIYMRRCSGCHQATATGGVEHEGQPAPPSLVDQKWDHGSSDGEIFWVIKKGAAPGVYMEPFGDRISDADIWNVVNFIRSLPQV